MSLFSRQRDKGCLIRLMSESDMESVRDVGQIAWSDLATKDAGRRSRYPKRSPKIIEAYMEADPGGCLVAEEDGHVIGSAFSHAWGKVGWIGPLEVLPNRQDRGIGKRLLAACEAHLAVEGCSVIGLETMHHNPKHMHFYMSSGYSPKGLTIIAERVADRDARDDGLVREAGPGMMGDVVPEITRLSRLVHPDLDYGKEADLTSRLGLGHVLVHAEDGRTDGAALLHTYHRAEEAPYSSVKMVLVDPRARDPGGVLKSLLQACERTSAAQGRARLLTRFSADLPDLYHALMGLNYSLKGTNVRMLKTGKYHELAEMSITSWAG